MKMVNTVELKNQTNALLRRVAGGEAVIVTLRGKPIAALTRLTDADLEAFVLRYGRLTLGNGQALTAPEESAYRYVTIPSPIGQVYVAYGARGPAMVDLAPSVSSFERKAARYLGSVPVSEEHPPADIMTDLLRSVRDHLPYRGRVDLSRVAPFERSVLRALRRIPSGQVRSYRDVARLVGKPQAARAVGTACAHNPLPLLIPCHRVVRTDGHLGGYSMEGGVALKRRLLEMEGALPQLPLSR